MNPYKVIDKNSWPRQNLFEFYQKFASSVFNVTVSVDAYNLYSHAKKQKESFFLMALYAILRAANEVPQMRQRVVDGEVVEFEKIAVMTPILTKHEMFCQIWCEYEATFSLFKANAAPEVEKAKSNMPSPMEDHGEDFFCASCVPWLHFTSTTPADYSFNQMVPVLTWGKMGKDNSVPISCNFNHCLLDGLHVSRFFNKIEQSFANPDSLYH
jgi:chloramphenicol O-acetyltransferase type A